MQKRFDLLCAEKHISKDRQKRCEKQGKARGHLLLYALCLNDFYCQAPVVFSFVNLKNSSIGTDEVLVHV